MRRGSGTSVDLEILVDRMFEHVLEEAERAELLTWIREWEVANPDVDAAHRVTGWIDVAYAFQSRSQSGQEVRDVVRKPAPSAGTSAFMAELA